MDSSTTRVATSRTLCRNPPRPLLVPAGAAGAASSPAPAWGTCMQHQQQLLHPSRCCLLGSACTAGERGSWQAGCMHIPHANGSMHAMHQRRSSLGWPQRECTDEGLRQDGLAPGTCAGFWCCCCRGTACACPGPVTSAACACCCCCDATAAAAAALRCSRAIACAAASAAVARSQSYSCVAAAGCGLPAMRPRRDSSPVWPTCTRAAGANFTGGHA